MSYIYCLIGKSGSGKDTVLEKLLSSRDIKIKKIVPYTTRPKRENEIEGVSYHYAKASDYLEIKSAPRLAKILKDLNVPYKTTKTWTTDAFYRETDRNLNLRKEEGCSIVEMECASIMSVGQFRQKEVYQFLYAADCLDGSNWDKRMLGNMPEDLRERILVVATEVASRL